MTDDQSHAARARAQSSSRVTFESRSCNTSMDPFGERMASNTDRYFICEGNRLRDGRQYAAAAEAYAAALTLAPERTDIRVQHANMLKDARRPAEAEAIYRQALAEAPADSDIHLQLGHALKLQGRHNEAVAAYRQAAALRPDNAEALRELF